MDLNSFSIPEKNSENLPRFCMIEHLDANKKTVGSHDVKPSFELLTSYETRSKG
jgi:hypothetical protein